MEHLPVEVIGNILSLLGDAQDSVLASATCKKWREAWQNHLHTLSFIYKDWSVYENLLTSEIEVIITETIFQTTRLQCLSISMGIVEDFSDTAVIAWLMHTRGTLRRFCFDGKMDPNVNIVEKFGKQKLEELAVSHIFIYSVHLNHPALRSLSLTNVSISALNLSLLLTICPKLEALSLISMAIEISDDEQKTMKLTSNSLKDVSVKSLILGKLILEADSIENLHLKHCTLELFELVGKGSLRILQIDDCKVASFDIGENTGNLEVSDVKVFTITLARFYHMISRSSKLRTLGLQGVAFQDEYGFVDFETLLACFPQLSHLTLADDHALNSASHLFCFPPLSQSSLNGNGSSYLQNVKVLGLGRTVLTEHFSSWVAGLLERCPRLKKLIIYGVVKGVESQVIADFTTSIVRHMRKYNHVDVEFKYK